MFSNKPFNNTLNKKFYSLFTETTLLQFSDTMLRSSVTLHHFYCGQKRKWSCYHITKSGSGLTEITIFAPHKAEYGAMVPAPIEHHSLFVVKTRIITLLPQTVED